MLLCVMFTFFFTDLEGRLHQKQTMCTLALNKTVHHFSLSLFRARAFNHLQLLPIRKKNTLFILDSVQKFHYNGSDWSLQRILTPNETYASMEFGYSVAVFNGIKVVGAPFYYLSSVIIGTSSDPKSIVLSPIYLL